MPAPQTFKNHTRFDPLFHFTLMPLLLANLIISIIVATHHRPHHFAYFFWPPILAVALILGFGAVRGSSLKVQDRVIRLEERLRLQALLTPEEFKHAQALTIGQLVGLRFASDEELPSLVKKTLAENLTRKQIKEAIVNWKPDEHRA